MMPPPVSGQLSSLPLLWCPFRVFRGSPQFQGREIKTIGDRFLAAFKCAGSALDYARALQGNTGHPRVQIRAGIHIGPMRVEEGDVFGGTVNFVARVVGAVKDAEIWLSERAKEDIDRLGAGKHKG